MISFGNKIKQECIPVGCVPAAHLPYSGVCFPGRGCAWSGGGLLGGGCLLPGGALPLGGGGFSLPVNRITHTCKNITLATTSLRPVNMAFMNSSSYFFTTVKSQDCTFLLTFSKVITKHNKPM